MERSNNNCTCKAGKMCKSCEACTKKCSDCKCGCKNSHPCKECKNDKHPMAK